MPVKSDSFQANREYQVAAAATINPRVCVCCASAATDDRMSELQIAIVAQFRK